MIPKTKKSVINDFDIMMYLALGLKHMRLMVLLVSLCLMVGLTYYAYARPIYRSKALVHYQSLPRPLDAEKVFKDERLGTIRKDLYSGHVLKRAAKRLGVDLNERDIRLKYLKSIRIGFDMASKNISIEVYPYSVEWAKKLPEALVQEYLLDREESRIKQLEYKTEVFAKDMAELKRLEIQLSNKQQDFQVTNSLTKIQIEFQQISQVPQDLLMTKNQLSVMGHFREMLKSDQLDTVSKLSLLSSMERDLQVKVGDLIQTETKEGNRQVVVVPQAITPPTPKPWEQYDKERAGLEQRSAELARVGYMQGHPKMKDVQKQLDAVNKALDLELQVTMNRFDLQYAQLIEKKATLEKKLPEYDEITKRHRVALQAYNRLSLQEMPWKNYYDLMEKSLSAVNYAIDKDRTDIQYKNLSEFSEVPVSPYRLKLLIYSLIAGLALAIAIPFLLEYLDSRLSDMDQVEEALKIRGLGVVPKITETSIDGLITLPLDDKRDHHLQENFRLIRTNLTMNAESPALPQVILVTSAMPQEGKTVVSSHLAMSFAKKGEKTLLIDADLRRGRLHRLFGCQNRPGLSEMLTESRTLEEVCRANVHPNLTVLSCGKHLHWASELLDSAVFPKLMEELRRKYQRIIIDTPPVLGLSETSILQRSCDGVMLVIWSEYTPMHNAKAAIQALATNGAKFCGFVLNRLDFSALTNRYKYFYYSPYYYGNYKALEAPPAIPAAPAV